MRWIGGMLAACAPSFAGCGGTGAVAFAERDSAGVVVAESTAPLSSAAESWTIDAEPAVEIGAVEGDPRYLFERVTGADVVGDRIVVADAGSLVVRTYSMAGAFLSEVGGEGEGPGEFRHISRMWRAGPGSVGVYDFRSYRVTELDLAQGGVETVRVAPDSVRPDQLMGELAGGGYVFNRIRLVGTASASGRDRMDLARFGNDGRFGAVIAEVEGLRRYVRPDGSGSVDPFTPMVYVSVAGDLLYVADSALPEVRVLDRDGGPVRIIRWRADAPDREGAMVELETALRRRDDRRGSMWDTRHAPRAEDVPVLSRLLVDARGFVWVRRYEVPDDSAWLDGSGRPGGEWWIFEPSGRWLGSVDMPRGLAPLSIGDGLMVGLRKDELGVEYVRVHGLHRG